MQSGICSRRTRGRSGYIEERRLDLTKKIAKARDDLITLRRSLGLPPTVFPLNQEEQKEPPSPLTPTRSTTTVASSLHKRPTLSYTT